jgi:hypothetical protein
MRKLLFTVPVLVAALGVFAVPASAGPPMPASGTRTTTITCTTQHTGGPNTFSDCERDFIWVTGTFVGTGVSHFSLIVHADGSLEFHGTHLFTGTVAGCGTGTVLFSLAGQGREVGGVLTLTKSDLTTLPGGTLSVHASLDTSALGSYTGQYFC